MAFFGRFDMNQIVGSHSLRFPTGEKVDVQKFLSVAPMNMAVGTCVTYERNEEVY